jgi:hypothetical protein
MITSGIRDFSYSVSARNHKVSPTTALTHLEDRYQDLPLGIRKLCSSGYTPANKEQDCRLFRCRLQTPTFSTYSSKTRPDTYAEILLETVKVDTAIFPVQKAIMPDLQSGIPQRGCILLRRGIWYEHLPPGRGRKASEECPSKTHCSSERDSLYCRNLMRPLISLVGGVLVVNHLHCVSSDEPCPRHRRT